MFIFVYASALHAVVECIVCCLMIIQPLDFKSIKSYLILSYLYMSMRKCDARLQAVPNPYYLDWVALPFRGVIITFYYLRDTAGRKPITNQPELKSGTQL